MVLRMNGLESLWCYMGVNLRCANIDVAQHHLDRSQIRSSLQKVAGKGMPECVGRDVFSDTAFQCSLLEDFPEALTRHRLTQTAHKKIGARRAFQQGRPCRYNVQIKATLSGLTNGHHPFF